MAPPTQLLETPMQKCPHCQSQDTERVRRDLWMRFVPNLVKLHCRNCDRTGLKFAKTTYTRLIEY
jgi:ribosomal protein L37AE/L43A